MHKLTTKSDPRSLQSLKSSKQIKPRLKTISKRHQTRKITTIPSTQSIVHPFSISTSSPLSTSCQQFSTALTPPTPHSDTHALELTKIPTTPIDPSTLKDTPLYMYENPASLEYYHFSNPKWGKMNNSTYLSTKKVPFQAILSHPAGQVLISQWIANHISLHLQNILKTPEDALKTKSNSILIGYDLNSEYSKDVHANSIEELPLSDPRHISNKTRLIYSPHTNEPDWGELTMADYGYVVYDPSKPSYQTQKKEYNTALEKHNQWTKLCGITPEEALEQEMQQRHHEEQAGDNLVTHFKSLSTQQILLESSSHSKPKLTLLEEVIAKEEETPVYKPKFKDMTISEQTTHVTSGVAKATVGLLYYSYTALARVTQIITPGGAQTLWKRFTDKITIDWISQQVYIISRALAIVTIRGGRKMYKKADSAAQAQIPFVNRFIRQRVDQVSGTLVTASTPILSTVQSTTSGVESAAKFVDEWIGTDYANAPRMKKIKQMSKFNTLLELQPHPGLAPEPPKGSPYDDIIPEKELFKKIKPSQNHSVHELLAVAEIDERRLLLSYIDRLRNTSSKTLALCPDELSLPPQVYETRINEKGMIEVPLQIQQTSIPELLLLSTSADTVYEQAGLRKHPNIWISKRILDKIPSPDLVDLAQQIKIIDPNWAVPKGLKLPPQSQGFGFNLATITKYAGLGFGLGVLFHEGVQVYNELQHAFDTFPDLSREEIVQDYGKFYMLRIKYASTALFDTAWHGITGRHYFPEYAADELAQEEYEREMNRSGMASIGVQSERLVSANDNSGAPQLRRQYSQEELQAIMEQIEQQLVHQNGHSENQSQQPEFTILTQEQADALMYFNQQQDSISQSRNKQ